MADCEKAFRGVVWSAIPVYWQLGVAGVPVMALFAAYLKKNKGSLRDVRGSFDMDPFGVWLRAGRLPMGIDRALQELAAGFLWAKKKCRRWASWA